jgi:hypothetical protein
MTIIDSQVNAYEANTPKRPWHNVPNWPDHVTGDEMVAEIGRNERVAIGEALHQGFPGEPEFRPTMEED